MELSPVNNVSEDEARSSLTRCCGASRWVQKMVAARPFASVDDLFAQSEKFADELNDEDWKESFRHHPKIGDMETLRQKFNTAKGWEAGEQSGAASASDAVLKELQEGNIDYENKFGYIFIVCATGKSAEEMLAILKSRLPNDPASEIKIAAGEQRKITKLRLEKLCQ